MHGMSCVLPLLMQSLIFFGQRSDLEQLLEEDIISNFVGGILESLSKAAVYEDFADKYFTFLPNLILDACFVLLRTTESERQQMYDNPNEFVQLALDTCEGQKSGTVKTQAAKLFEALTDNISGALTLTTFYSLQAINKTLSKESGKEPLNMSQFSASIDAQ